MKLRVLAFSIFRDIVGGDEVEVEVPPGSTVAGLLEELGRRFPKIADWDGRILVAIDLEYAGPEDTLAEGQEVAIMPPVQGG